MEFVGTGFADWESFVESWKFADFVFAGQGMKVGTLVLAVPGYTGGLFVIAILDFVETDFVECRHSQDSRNIRDSLVESWRIVFAGFGRKAGTLEWVTPFLYLDCSLDCSLLFHCDQN